MAEACFNCGNTRRGLIRIDGEGLLCRPCREYLCEIWPSAHPQGAL
jgi:hypothetical protein